MPEKKPNILLLISDEYRPSALAAEGDPHIRTPTLDRLISEGVYFRNAYTPSPVCVPARQSFLSGRMPRNAGCLNFGDPMPSEVVTIPGHLSRYGYRAVAGGKMHFVGPDVMHGWHERIGRDIKGRNGYELVDDPRHAAEVRPEPGTGHWSQINKPHSKFKAEVQHARAGEDQWMRHDRYTVDGILDFLDEYFVNESYDRTGANPLLLCVSLHAPHFPFCCPKELFDYYMPRVRPIVEDLPDGFECHEMSKVRIGTDVTYREAHRATAAYYGRIEWMDRQFGRVMDTLEHLDLIDDFVVLFISDHGEMLGERGVWMKQQYFENSVRVPFIVRGPGALSGGRVVGDNVSLLDLFPTLCDIANVPHPPGLDGFSLLPLLHGGARARPDEVYSELWNVPNGPSAMVKEGSLKYFRYDNGKGWPDQLFDLAKDPQEQMNLVGDPAYAQDLARLRAKLDALPPPREKDARNRFVG